MGVNPRAIIITVPKVEGGFVQSEILSCSKSSHPPVLDLNAVKEMENRLLPADPHSTMNDRRKRRLNHLTFEEKLHRKKLKNRVAAQTSRDRKKAKMDELEKTNQTLQDQNAKLLAECAMLRLENVHLTETNEKLQKELAGRVSGTSSCQSCSAKLTSYPGNPHTPGPAESSGSLPLLKGWGYWMNQSRLENGMTTLDGIRMFITLAMGHSSLTTTRLFSGPYQSSHPSSNFSVINSEDMAVDNFNLPSLPDLLEDLDNWDDFGYLEELAESLLQDAKSFAEVEGSESSQCAEVVGQTSKNVEPNGTATNDIHDSPLKEWYPAISVEPVSSSAQFQELFDEMATSVTDKEENLDCITVVIPSEESQENTVFLEEAVEEVVTSDVTFEEVEEVVSLQPTSPLSDPENLKMDSYSDHGYESLDSPHSDVSSDSSIKYIWNENLSNLFPDLV